jgi:serine/threonine protein phosphatase PrpC
MAKYRGFKAKCQGFSHKASDTPTPCQDAVAYKYGEGFAICAAADGHGSEKYFRSGNGAEIAVKIAVEAVKTFLNSRMVLSEENFNKLLKDLAAYIVSKWIDETRKHWDTTPCNDDEKTVFAKHYPNQNPLDKTLNVPRIYGTTLIVGAITEDFAFIIQCGDGAACIIPQDGNPNIPPVTIDENQIGGLANSISSLNCLTLFRYYYTDEIPISMLLVSDGVWTSYGGNNGDDFLRFCEKVLELYSRDYDQAQGFLEDWLPQLSERGSQDDMSIAGVFLLPEADPDVNDVLEKQ